MKIDWCTSRTVIVALDPGANTTLHCPPGGSAVMALWHMLRPGAYIRLDHRL